MASYKHRLQAITDKRQAPFVTVQETITGADYLHIYAGNQYGIDNVWQLVSARFGIVCDATVANRLFHMQHYANDPTVYWDSSSGAITASQSRVINIAPIALNTSVVDTGGVYLLGSGLDLFTIFGVEGRLSFYIDNGVVGDLFQCSLLLKFKNWELGMQSAEMYVGK